MPRRGRLLAGPLVAASLLLAGCSGPEPDPVQVAEVVRATVTEVVDAPGTVTARASSTLSAPADGTVEAVLVADGTAVTRGTLLVRLASPAAQERLRQARSARAAASGAQVPVPQADLGPLQDQLDEAAAAAFSTARDAAAAVPDETARAASLAAVATAEARYAATAAAARRVTASVAAGTAGVGEALAALGSSQRLQADALVRAAQATVDALTVVAPQDGVVTYGGPAAPGSGGGLEGLLGALPPGLAAGLPAGAAPAPAARTSTDLAVGVPVSAGSPLLTVTDVSELGVSAEVDETDVLLVRPGVPATVELDALPDRPLPATVAAVDVTPSPAGSGGVTYRVRLVLTEVAAEPAGGRPPAPRPLPGMSAVVDLQVREAVGAVSVPSAAVVRDGPREAVFVQVDGVYRRREVQLGAQGSDRVEVLAGLQVGERVVTRDADRLRDGQAV